MKYTIASMVSILLYILGRSLDIQWMELLGFVSVIILAVVGGIKYLFEVQKYWEDENI